MKSLYILLGLTLLTACNDKKIETNVDGNTESISKGKKVSAPQFNEQAFAVKRSEAFQSQRVILMKDQARRAEHKAKAIKHNDKTMKYFMKKIGPKPKTGYPLYIFILPAPLCLSF